MAFRLTAADIETSVLRISGYDASAEAPWSTTDNLIAMRCLACGGPVGLKVTRCPSCGSDPVRVFTRKSKAGRDCAVWEVR